MIKPAHVGPRTDWQVMDRQPAFSRSDVYFKNRLIGRVRLIHNAPPTYIAEWADGSAIGGSFTTSWHAVDAIVDAAGEEPEATETNTQETTLDVIKAELKRSQQRGLVHTGPEVES